jgi:copper chaperone
MKSTTLTLLVALGCLAPLGCKQEGQNTAANTTDTTEATIKTAKVEKTVVYSVKGMNCGGCASAIATKLDKMDGVVTCDVSLEGQKATVELASNGSPSDVEEAIRSLGYTVEPEPTNPAS